MNLKIKNNEELELRFFNSNLSLPKFNSIFTNKIFNKKKIESETVIVESNNKMYEKNLKTNIVYLRKKKTIKKIELTNIDIVLSNDELIETDEQLELITFIRYKKRTTKFIDKFKNWKFDFTIGTQFKVDKILNNALLNVDRHDKFYQFEIELIKNPTNLDKEIHELIELFIDNKIRFNTEFFFKKKLSELPTQVKSLSLKNVDEITENYAVTEKADGERYLILIYQNKIYRINRASDIELIEEGKYDDMLLDTELVNKKYMYFDILKHKNINTTTKLFLERQKILDKIKLSNNFIRKQFKYHDNIFKLSDEIYNKKYKYELDGLIYTPINKDYFAMSYKWKPLKDLTIDFLVRLNKEFDDYNEYDLYVRMTKRLIYNMKLPIYKKLFELFPFIKNINSMPYLFMPNKNRNYHTVKLKKNIIKDNTIVEFNYDKGWKVYRMREDKTKLYNESIQNNNFAGPNGYHTALSNWNIIQNPVTTDMITGKENLPYFRGTNFKSSSIKQMNIYHHKIKTLIYQKSFNNGNILELSGGRGGDLYSLEELNANKILFIDYDKQALQQAVNKWIKIKNQKQSKTIICFQDANLQLDQSKLIIKLSKQFDFDKFDLVSCQFAFHYFYNSQKTFDNIINTVNSRIKTNGKFIITMFDGETVNNKFVDNVIDIKNKQNTVFKIQKKYTTYKDFNNEIEVFGETIGTHNENLIDYNKFIKNMNSHHFELLESKMFKDTIDNNYLNDYEKQFSNLSRYYIFVKK